MSGVGGEQPDRRSDGSEGTDRATRGSDWWLLVMLALAVVAASTLVVVAATVLFK